MGPGYDVCVIPGDGIGPEVTREALRVLDAAASRHRITLRIDEQPWGSAYYRRTGRMMPADGPEVVGRADATLFGAVGSPDIPDAVTVGDLILALRRDLDLYLNLRPIDDVRGSGGEVGSGRFDLLIIRENTEGEYMGVGGRQFRGTDAEVAVQNSIFTARGVGRVMRYAFEHTPPGKLLTSVTKSNALPDTMGLWDDIADRTAAEHPNVRWERMHVDAVAYQMVRDPSRFDVLVASNLFGDILSDLGAGLQGSLGFAASGNINPVTGIGLFEPIHGSAPDIAGRGIANPSGAIRSVALLWEFLGEADAASSVRAALASTLGDGIATADIGGGASTSEFGAEVVARIDS